MHDLKTIIRKNAEAAGREAAYAKNDGDAKKEEDIKVAQVLHRSETFGIGSTYDAFYDGYESIPEE